MKQIESYRHPATSATQEPDPRPGDYFVAARDGERYGLVHGPFPTHREALLAVDDARRALEGLDPRAHWYAFGTLRLKPGSDRVGFLQKLGTHPRPS